MRVLVYTDGSTEAENAAALLRQLGAAGETEVTVLGVAERSKQSPEVEASADRIEQDLEREGSDVKTVLRSGEASKEIVDEARRGQYDLVIVARRSPERQPQLKLRSTTGTLARHVPAHLLIARNVPDKLDRILICSGAEAPSAETVRLAGLLTAASDADISLLHVMSQVALHRDSPAEELEETAEEAIDQQTREGHHLQEAIELLRREGVKTEIEPILRHGLVVEQVLEEIREGDYDLMVLGSHQQPTMTRWMDVLLGDVAGELLSKSPISVLVIYPRAPAEDPPHD